MAKMGRNRPKTGIFHQFQAYLCATFVPLFSILCHFCPVLCHFLKHFLGRFMLKTTFVPFIFGTN
jgi:hypothetical protein